MSVKLLSEHNLEFLRLKEVCTFSLESTRVGVIKIVIVINCNLITFSKVIACNCN